MSRYAKKIQSQPPRALPVPSQHVESTFLSLQRTQHWLVGLLVICAVLGITVFRGAPGNLGNRVYMPIIISTTLLTFAYTLRNSMVLPALAELRRNPRDPGILARWKRNNLIVQSLCAAVGLLGFAMQLMGAAIAVSLTLYAIAVVYLFLLAPARP
jgi:hypothetical protein